MASRRRIVIRWVISVVFRTRDVATEDPDRARESPELSARRPRDTAAIRTRALCMPSMRRRFVARYDFSQKNLSPLFKQI